MNVKQGSCEYQLFKSFDLTRQRNRSHVYKRSIKSMIYLLLLGSGTSQHLTAALELINTILSIGVR